MESIFRNVLKELGGINGNIFRSFKDDLFFPQPSKSLEEQLFSRIRRQNSLIENQQSRLSSQAGSIEEMDREIRDLKDLLTQKDKEIALLKERIRSLERQER